MVADKVAFQDKSAVNEQAGEAVSKFQAEAHTTSKAALKHARAVKKDSRGASAAHLPQMDLVDEHSDQTHRHSAAKNKNRNHNAANVEQAAPVAGETRPAPTTSADYTQAGDVASEHQNQPLSTYETGDVSSKGHAEVKQSSSDDSSTQYTLTRDSINRITNVECPSVPGETNNRSVEYHSCGAIQHAEVNALDNKVSADRISDTQFHYVVRDRVGRLQSEYNAGPPALSENGDVTIPGRDNKGKTVYKANGAEVSSDNQGRVTHTVNADGLKFDMKYHDNDKDAYLVNASSPNGEAYSLQKSDLGGYVVTGREGQRTATACAGAYSLSLPEKVGSFKADTNGNVFVTHTDWTNVTGGFPHQEIVFAADGTMTRAIANQPLEAGGPILVLPRQPVLWERKGRDGSIIQSDSTDKIPAGIQKTATEEGWQIRPPIGMGSDSWWARRNEQLPPSFDPMS